MSPGPDRRAWLRHGLTVAGLLAASGLLPRLARAQASADWSEIVQALGGSLPVESAAVSISGPAIADDGASVPLGASTTLAGVTRLLILAQHSPATLVARFDLSPSVAANFALRAKLTASSEVYAVALLADGRACYARRFIEVTQGACGA